MPHCLSVYRSARFKEIDRRSENTDYASQLTFLNFHRLLEHSTTHYKQDHVLRIISTGVYVSSAP